MSRPSLSDNRAAHHRARMLPLRTHPRAFSLLEVVVVLVVLGVAAAIAAPRMSRAAQAARESACRATLRTYANALEQFQGIHGQYPSGITPTVLDMTYLPASPFGGSQVNPISREVSGDPTIIHPAAKRFRPDNPAAKTFWYNPANGVFRALVPLTADPAADIALYNRLNDCRLGQGSLGAEAAPAEPEEPLVEFEAPMLELN
jgi:general secretion pathway protein G